ncbi:MAG: GNAT family N-acetyltransferase [Candidatus Methylomirabilales bacterium]
MEIRPAHSTDAEALTRLAHASKRYWQYPEVYIRLWKDALTVTPEFVEHHDVYCAVQGTEMLGFYALSGEGPIRELEHLWVAPEHIGRGIGTRLLDHALDTMRPEGGRALRIASDPNAEGFYRRRGAQRVGAVPSTPEGRTLPLLVLELE